MEFTLRYVHPEEMVQHLLVLEHRPQSVHSQGQVSRSAVSRMSHPYHTMVPRRKADAEDAGSEEA